VLDHLAGTPGGAVERVHRLLVHTQLLRVVQFEDFLAMRVTVEARFPFLDHRVAEWCFSHPFDLHIEPETRRGKSVLRAGMNGLLPQEVLQRRKEVFPYPDSMRLHAALTALATEHEPELHADPLVASMFELVSVRLAVA
jgi:asparagine synthase (glutamine-hydrolysing)